MADTKKTVIDTTPARDFDADQTDIVVEDAEADFGTVETSDVVNEDADDIATLPRGAEEQADGSVIVTLARSVDLVLKSNERGTRKETTTSIRFHRLSGKDLTEITSAADKVREKVAFALSARMNKAKMNALFDRMDAADIGRCGQVLEYFLGSGRKTGRT